MRLLAALGVLSALALAGHARAQPPNTPWPSQCPAGTPSGTLGCFPQAATPGSTDLLYGWQVNQSPHTRAFQYQQIINGGGDISQQTVLAPSPATTARTLAQRAAECNADSSRCVLYNVKDYGALSNGTDDAPHIQAAIDAACASGQHATVFLPGGAYTVGSTLTLHCSFLSFQGASVGTTWLLPTFAGDVVKCALNPVSQYIFDCNISNLLITTTSNPASGAGIHVVEGSQANIHDVTVQGTFYGFQFSAAIRSKLTNAWVGGSNSTAGSAAFETDSNGGVNNAANLFVSSLDATPSTLGGYTYGALITSADGVQFVTSYFSRASSANIYLHPTQTTDSIDNVIWTNGVLDLGNYGVLCDTEPGSYVGNLGQIQFTGGSQIHGATLDGFKNACADMYGVVLNGTIFLANGSSGLNLSAGSDFAVEGATFDGNGHTGAVAQALLQGTVSGVNLNGSRFKKNKLLTAPVNVQVNDTAGNIQAAGVTYSDATSADIAFSASTGTNLALEPYLTDKLLTAGSFTGIGSTGAAQLNAGSTLFKGTIQLVPSGAGIAATGTVLLTWPAPAAHHYVCAFIANHGGAGWTAPATFDEVLGGPATTKITLNWTNGAVLTGAVAYLIDYQCRTD